MLQIRMLTALLLVAPAVMAQDDLSKMFGKDSVSRGPVIATFKSTRIINGQSNETLKKGELDFRVAHRFGDLGGEAGGSKTFFGIDNSTDIRIAFEYGITDRLMVGLSRAKGSGNFSQMYEGLAKFKILQQTIDNRIPLGIAVFGNAVVTSMKSSTVESDAAYFDNFSSRMSYTGQVILSRKFGNILSLAVLPTYVHRNRVVHMDVNDMFAVGVGGRLRFSKRLALVVDYFLPFREQASKDYFEGRGVKFYNPLGVGLEIETGGHVFSVNFTNSTAILENQFIPETTSTWLEGQFRWGFNISRRFSLGGK
ncbi:DUF5777 family beta-barrel protein [Chitinophaga niabensis]|uniref:DUF5777 domain-containing protein n=1 Tax=Chitinophaga niabensis TaxID=536979 RepID=A0A1N6JAJ2_9BACT|nr:DUF5777 family beta-barrel protein [Chitinophaga niabensis]SIO41169.1 hypothetical protein SAMN04488055_3791 [Chitinophaga niabensis]